MTLTIDLNADMGEFNDDNSAATEAALMDHITSCSIACGGHAGNDDTMKVTVERARHANVSIGAHPAYPDREGFGRRSLGFEPGLLLQSLIEQIEDLKKVLQAHGLKLNHVKPHGALYNDAAKDGALADIVLAAVKEACADAILVGPPGSCVEKAATAANQRFAAEGFVDRLYLPTGALTPRSMEGAIIADIEERAKQAVAIASHTPLQLETETLQIEAQTLCIHSDSPGAVETALAVKNALLRNGFELKSFA